jgi:hypothetical protein
MEFTITEGDILPLPKFCPILGLELVYPGFSDGMGRAPNLASIDRIDNSRGYVPGNVVVVSLRANTLKGSGTPEEIHALSNWLKGLSTNEHS